ncbi:hypothetical protein [Nocardioides plantarum]|uniref:Septum formation-related domain-containing protein n=1 Tax=Nocardioides plantarum TaxID=29299 RepID=A0ABV5KCT4_9ACTN|nr:hypothetical protein [Nocardioides plantarum]
MTYDDRLKELLDSTAPDRPDLPAAARTSAVRERAVVVRRRSRLVLAAAVVAVVGIGVGVSVLASGDDPDRGTEVADDPAPTTTPAPPPCPAEPPVLDETSTKADFPDGATSLRLCPATFDTAGDLGKFLLPTAPVTTGVDALVDRLAAQPEFAMDPECAAISLAPMPWTLVVAYPDGSTVSVGATMTRCASVTLDGHEVDVESTLRTVEAATQPEPEPGPTEPEPT